MTAEARATVMMMEASNSSARQITLALRRAPSNITRELSRFGSWPNRPTLAANTPLEYDARTAGLLAQRARFKRRKRSKLASDTVLFGVVQHFLAQGWSPLQIAGTLKLMWHDEPIRTVSRNHQHLHLCNAKKRVAQAADRLFSPRKGKAHGTQAGRGPHGPDARLTEHPCAPARGQ